MVWQHVQIEQGNSFNGNSGNDTIHIPRGACIGDLMLTVRAQNGATRNVTDDGTLQTINESIEEIKVMAGSRVIFEASGQRCQDWNTYRTGRMPYKDFDQRVGGTYPAGWQEAVYNIPFGRFPGDEVVGLPAPIYGALDLKIKYDFTVSATAGYATGTAKRDIYMDIMGPKSSEQMNSMKVLEHRKVRDHTSIVSGIEPVSLTTDPSRQLRQIMVSCYETGIAEGVDVSKVGFFVNHSEVFGTEDWNAIQFANAMDCKLNYRQVVKNIEAAADGDIIRSMIPNVSPIFTALTTTSEDAYLATTGDAITLTGQTADDEGVLVMHSDVIPCCTFIDFDKNSSMRNLVNRGVLDLTLKLTQGGAGGAVEIHEQNVSPAMG